MYHPGHSFSLILCNLWWLHIIPFAGGWPPLKSRILLYMCIVLFFALFFAEINLLYFGQDGNSWIDCDRIIASCATCRNGGREGEKKKSQAPSARLDIGVRRSLERGASDSDWHCGATLCATLLTCCSRESRVAVRPNGFSVCHLCVQAVDENKGAEECKLWVVL